MKLIILIQTLIIIAGGYYVYLLTHEKEVPVAAEPTIEMNIESDLPKDGYVPPTENPPAETIVDETGPIGHSDMGMEFPIPDDDLQVR